MVVAERSTQASLEGFDDRLSEAAADLGASGWTAFRTVVLPVIRPGVLAGALLAFVSALGEFVPSRNLEGHALLRKRALGAHNALRQR